MRRDVVVIGGSAGSLRPLAILIKRLPTNLSAAVFIVQHVPPGFWTPATLIGILQQETPNRIEAARDGERVEQGTIYVCPADQHLLLENGLMRLDQGPKEHYNRPSVDVLFRSAAATYGRRVIAVLLSGLLKDGVAGLWQVRKHGGVVLIQDPLEAEFRDMPSSAIESVPAQHVLPAVQLAEVLAGLITEEATHDEARKVLIVEDEGLVARNVSQQLSQAGFLVGGVARSGEDAIRLATEKVPDLVLMDIRLEGSMTGVQAARSIWESLQIPIVFVTANADASTLDDVKTVPNYGYVVKPFHGASLQAVVELALDRREKELRHVSDWAAARD